MDIIDNVGSRLYILTNLHQPNFQGGVHCRCFRPQTNELEGLDTSNQKCADGIHRRRQNFR